MNDEKPIVKAHKLRRAGDFSQAGDFYTIWAHRRYARTLPDSPWFGAGLVSLQRAALCYRLADYPGRCENRCRQGILIAQDMIDRVFDTDPEYPIDRARRGVWHEHIGDFRTIGDIGNVSEAYDSATDVYLAADDPDTFSAEQEQSAVIELFRELAQATCRDPPDLESHEDDRTLSEWVAYKQEHLPQIIDDLLEQGEWP